MRLITFKKLDIIFRDLDDVIIIKNIRLNEILTLENVSADIWRYIASKPNVEFIDLATHISNIYNIGTSDIINDIELFIDELYKSGVILINGKYFDHHLANKTSIQHHQQDIEGQIIKLYQTRDIVSSVTFELTYSCNEKCIHCYANYPNNSNKKRKLTLKQLQNVINDLFQMKCMHISFTGGDPFMFADFVDLFEYARNLGFSCDIYTNAVYLADHPDILTRILSLKPQAIFISLYGADAETHESITNTPNTFNKTISSIKAIRDAGTPVILNIMLLKNNVDKLNSIISLVKELNVEYRIGMSLIYKNDGNDSPMNYFINNKDAIKKVLTIERQRFFSIDQQIGNNNRDFFCNAARTSLAISPDGTVYPCISLKIIMGNICNESISGIWRSEQRIKLLSYLSWENAKQCKECKHLDKCPHCIGISQSETGDMFSCNTCDKMIAECMDEINY